MSAKKRLLYITLITALILAQEVMPNGLLFNPLKDFIHYMVFAVIAFWLLQETQQHQPITLRTMIFLVIALSAVGGLIEIVQPYFQRSRSWIDFSYDLAGSVLGCILFSLQSNNKRNAAKYLTACIISVTALLPPGFGAYGFWLQKEQLPILMDFEQPTLLPLIHWSNAPAPAVQMAPSDWITNSTHVGAFTLTGTNWVNLGLKNLPQDWSKYKNLYLEIFSANEQLIPLGLRIVDLEHNWEYDDRFNLTLPLQPGLNPIRIPLSRIESGPKNRLLNLKQVQEILLFSRPRDDAAKFYIDNIRLEP